MNEENPQRAHQQLAAFLLDLVKTTSVAADDQTLQTTMAARNWLRCVATGEFVVTPRPKPQVVPLPVEKLPDTSGK